MRRRQSHYDCAAPVVNDHYRNGMARADSEALEMTANQGGRVEPEVIRGDTDGVGDSKALWIPYTA